MPAARAACNGRGRTRGYNPGANSNLSPLRVPQGLTLSAATRRTARAGPGSGTPVNVFYEEDGGFKVAAVLSEAEASLQVEAAHGKRSKIKASAVLLRFDRPPLAAFRDAADALAEGIDADFLWEVAPREEFGFDELARDYFGREPAAVEAAALLLRLHASPMYFYKKGRGRYKTATPEALKSALASAERKRREAEQVEEFATELTQFRMPEALVPQVQMLLYRPEKQSVAYRALDAACAATGLPPARLLHRAGALAGPYEHLLGRFLAEHFPRGTRFAPHPAAEPPAELPLAPAPAFSIDDAATTEIDDAFSVASGVSGRLRIGIHIAAPALGFSPDGDLDAIARARMSTVYMPGAKITMLPDEVVEAFTLKAGRTVPCVSLYLEVEPADMAVADVETRLERIAVASNLRHHELDDILTEASLASGAGTYPHAAELAHLWRLACRLEAGRGRASHNQAFRDYNFRIDWQEPGRPVEEARVVIEERRRGAPLDKIVSELMILANHTWGRLLADRGAAAIYRVKTGAGPAGKVRMTTVPAPHVGLGVSHYAWSSSPLRRYVDLVNQWQLAAVLRGAKPPFAPRSESLLGAVAGFEAAHAGYASFQRSMERYWCLRWLAQEGHVGGADALTGSVGRDGNVRLDGIPLGGPVAGMPSLAPGTRVQVRVRGIDLWQLTADLVFAGEIGAPAEDISAEAEENGGDTD
ncbi:MAG: RNB domain-containing ribonuclease [Burkholderiales bacterium]|nr:RNB domain-containing ribonuclease [Burkholderiales bacterium]